jgi:phosphatidate cytidylyltransferase
LAATIGITETPPPRGAVLFVVALALVPLMAREATRMLERTGLMASRTLAMTAATITFAVAASLPFVRSPLEAAALAGTLFLGLLVAGLIRFSRGQNVRGVMAATGGLLLVCVYAGILMAFWMLIRHDHSAWVLVGAILTTKSCDIGAYFTGVSIGRHKLIPWLSPGKTWEGLLGGVAAAAAVGAGLALLSARLPQPADHIHWAVGLVGGVLVALIGQFGDLAESLLKRDAGVKDSGTLLPGMGGVLDVLDSPLMAGPAVYWLLALST